MSGLASSFVKPGKKSASGTSAGPVNHSSPVPESWMPKSVPFRVMATTMLLPSMSRAASSVALHAGMERFRKKWSFPLMKSRTLRRRRAVAARLDDRRREHAVEQRRGGAVPVVDLVPHVERLRDDVLEVDGTRDLQRALERRVEDLVHPVELRRRPRRRRRRSGGPCPAPRSSCSRRRSRTPRS